MKLATSSILEKYKSILENGVYLALPFCGVPSFMIQRFVKYQIGKCTLTVHVHVGFSCADP